MESIKTEIELINAKLDQIHSVIGFILERINLMPQKEKVSVEKNKTPIVIEVDEGEETGDDDDFDARDINGSVLS